MHGLYKISDVIPDAIIDMKYSGTDNVAHRKISGLEYTLLRRKPLEALKIAADNLRAEGYKLVIWDAYRTPDTQSILRSICDDDRYVSNESDHSRGIAIDLTLADNNGQILDMGTKFDEFDKKAHLKSEDITIIQKENRKILHKAMKSAGFSSLPTEWWHFAYLAIGKPSIITVKEIIYAGI